MRTPTGTLRVLVTPAGLSDLDLSQDLVVVIDVLRAGTTIAHALAAGARGVIPVEGVEDASRLASKLGREDTVLGGERESVRVEGFDCGNSPLEYTETVVADKTVVLSTTNGARALARSAGARECLAASLVCREAVARRAAGFDRVLIVCAGQKGFFSFEDFLCAGRIIESMLRVKPGGFALQDGARAALELSRTRADGLLDLVRDSDHGRALAALGAEEDLKAACRIDRFDFVPVLRDGRVVAEDPVPGRSAR